MVLWRGGDLYSSQTLVNLCYRVEQIRKCDMYSVYKRQQRVEGTLGSIYAERNVVDWFVEKKIKGRKNLRRQKTYEYFVSVIDVRNSIKQSWPLSLLNDII